MEIYGDRLEDGREEETEREIWRGRDIWGGRQRDK